MSHGFGFTDVPNRCFSFRVLGYCCSGYALFVVVFSEFCRLFEEGGYCLLLFADLPSAFVDGAWNDEVLGWVSSFESGNLIHEINVGAVHGEAPSQDVQCGVDLYDFGGRWWAILLSACLGGQ